MERLHLFVCQALTEALADGEVIPLLSQIKEMGWQTEQPSPLDSIGFFPHLATSHSPDYGDCNRHSARGDPPKSETPAPLAGGNRGETLNQNPDAVKLIRQSSESKAKARLACWYAQCLWLPVFPVGQDKRPLTCHGYKDASRDFGQIEEWWSRWPNALIAVPTGAEYSRLVVLDLDIKDGKDGLASLRAAGLTCGRSWLARSRSGGFHVYFLHPGLGVRVASKAEITVRGRKLAGVDVRGDGGSIIVPGIRDRYRWTVQRPGRTALAEMPAWFRDWAEDETTPKVSARVAYPSRPIGDGTGILTDVCERIAGAVPGSRQETVAHQAWRAGRLVAEGRANEREALGAVISATASIPPFPTANGPWSPRAAVATAERAFREGARHG